MAGQGNQGDRLVKFTDFNVEQSFAIASHIGADPAAGDHLAVAVNPSDRMRTSCRAGRNQPSPCQQVDVELQGLLLQTYPLPRSRHFHRSINSESQIPIAAQSAATRTRPCSSSASTAQLGWER